MSSKISEYISKTADSKFLRLAISVICLLLLFYIAVKVGSEFLVSSPGGPYFVGADYLPDKYMPPTNWPYFEHLSPTSPVSIAEDARLSSIVY